MIRRDGETLVQPVLIDSARFHLLFPPSEMYIRGDAKPDGESAHEFDEEATDNESATDSSKSTGPPDARTTPLRCCSGGEAAFFVIGRPSSSPPLLLVFASILRVFRIDKALDVVSVDCGGREVTSRKAKRAILAVAGKREYVVASQTLLVSEEDSPIESLSSSSKPCRLIELGSVAGVSWRRDANFPSFFMVSGDDEDEVASTAGGGDELLLLLLWCNGDGGIQELPPSRAYRFKATSVVNSVGVWEMSSSLDASSSSSSSSSS